MRRVFVSIIFLLGLLTSLVSCLPQLKPEIDQSDLELQNGYRISTFVTNLLWDVNGQTNFRINLQQLDGSNIYELGARCEFSKKGMKVSISIPDGISIEDGEYVITSPAFGADVLKRYKAKFESQKVTYIDDIVVNFYSDGFNGSGTMYSPYIVANASDLNYLLFCLSMDDQRGAGIYFQQIADIEWGSGGLERRSLGTESFSGFYDGGNYAIKNLTYNGAKGENDNSRGLFRVLSNGALIQNLKLDNIQISNASDTIGAVAAIVSGTVTLNNLSVSGRINGSDVLGGMVGYLGKKNNALLTVKNCKLNVTVEGSGDYIGGVAGVADGVTLEVSNTTTLSSDGSSFSADRFVLTGNRYIGGLVGIANGCSLSVDGLKLYHSSNIDNTDVFILNGNEYVGGLSGYFEAGPKSEILNSDLVLLISGSGKYVGGYFGSAKLDAAELFVKSSKFTGVVKGSERVGGVSGTLSLGNNTRVSMAGFQYESNSDLESPYRIEGKSYIGGLFGEVSGSGKQSSALLLQNVSLGANVTSVMNSEDYGYVGGIAGRVVNTKVEMQSTTIGSGTTEIKGPFKVGGLIGELENSSLDSDNNYNINNSSPVIPALKSLYCNFDGKVKPFDQKVSARYIGGGVGNVQKSAVDGLHIKADVTGTGDYTGGVFGLVCFESDLVISDCSFVGSVTGGTYTGGIVGEVQSRGKISECINYGTVSGGNNVGGVAGKMYADSDEPYVEYCVNIGNVSGAEEIGGVVGLMASGDDDWCKIRKCANYGKVSGTSTTNYTGIGGILGESTREYTNVQYCVNFGAVEGTGTSGKVCIGGVVGKIGSSSPYYTPNVSLRECANYASVTSGSSSAYIGGVAGYLEKGIDLYEENSEIENCYNDGDISYEGDHRPGGIVGCVDLNCVTAKCINYGNIPHGNGVIGTHEGSSWEYKQIYTLEGTYYPDSKWPDDTHVFTAEQMGDSGYWGDTQLDFSNVWIIKNGRPELVNCPFQYSKAPID